MKLPLLRHLLQFKIGNLESTGSRRMPTAQICAEMDWLTQRCKENLSYRKAHRPNPLVGAEEFRGPRFCADWISQSHRHLRLDTDGLDNFESVAQLLRVHSCAIE
jgi:hypothetical protein